MLNIGGGVVAVVEAAYFSAIYFGEGFNSAIFAESRQIKNRQIALLQHAYALAFGRSPNLNSPIRSLDRFAKFNARQNFLLYRIIICL